MLLNSVCEWAGINKVGLELGLAWMAVVVFGVFCLGVGEERGAWDGRGGCRV